MLCMPVESKIQTRGAQASGSAVVQFRSETLRRRGSVANGPLDAAGDEETLLDLGRVSRMHRDGFVQMWYSGILRISQKWPKLSKTVISLRLC